MRLIGFLILFPLLPAFLLALVPQAAFRAWLVRLSVLAIAAASIVLAAQYMGGPGSFFKFDQPWTEKALFLWEAVLALYLLYRCKDIQWKEAWIPLLLLAGRCG